jgi:hypothetical protein
MDFRGSTKGKMILRSNDLLKTLRDDYPSITLQDGRLISAKLSFKLSQVGSSRRPVTVEIRPPERTNLNKKREVDVIEAYLRENGVLLA